MELRHLRYAVAVAESLHFGRAAERLHMSQPPLSLQIRQLEEELGIKLFARTKRQVQVTKTGEIFIDEARVILAQAEHAAKLALRVSNGEIGQLTIAVAGPADAQIFIDIFSLFAKRHPKARIVLRNIGTAQQAQALREGRIHIGFLVPPIDDPALVLETVVQRPIVIALPRRHPLAARASVPLRALAAESHVMFARDLAPRFFDAILSACQEAGFSLNVMHEVDNLHTACALVAAGLGVSFVPAGIQTAVTSPIVLRPLKPRLRHVDSPLAMAYRRESSSDLVRLFVAVVQEVVARRSRKAKGTGR